MTPAKLQSLERALQRALALRERKDLSALANDYACVALILRWHCQQLYLGFIRRADMPSDPWSGHLALPGGRREASDKNDLAAALRETAEEVGIQLPEARAIGTLDDIQARRSGKLLPFFLRPFLFLLEGSEPELRLDPNEVDKFYWIRADYLLDPANHVEFPWEKEAQPLKLPGIRFPTGQVLWGLTYMILTDFMERLAAARVQNEFSLLRNLDDLSFWKKVPKRRAHL